MSAITLQSGRLVVAFWSLLFSVAQYSRRWMKMSALYINKNNISVFPVLIWMAQILLLCCSSTHGLRFGKVSCDYSGITLNIFSERKFEGVVYAEGNFFNPTCRYIPTFESIGRNITLFLPLVDCGTLIREVDGTIYISNTVIVQKHRIVETVSDVTHNISCQLPNPDSFETNAFWTYGNHSSRYKNEALESWMDFQSGSVILGKEVPNTLFVGDEFLMTVHLKDGGINKALQVESCWAHDKESIKDSWYTLHIYDRKSCKNSDWVSRFNITRGMKNVSDTMAYALIKAFKFPATKNVYISCSVQICTNNCWDYCKIPEYGRSNSYPQKAKRSLTNDSNKSLRNKYKLMKATVKALGAKLVESNRAHKSGNHSSFRRRISKAEDTTTQDYKIDLQSEAGDFYAEDNITASNNSQSPGSNDSSNDYGPELEYFNNDVYLFNLTNHLVVFTGHEFNFRQKVASTELGAYCVSKFKFRLAIGALGFIVFCLAIICIGLVLYLRKEQKRKKINNFLLYNLY